MEPVSISELDGNTAHVKTKSALKSHAQQIH